jgi:hypothetical protein
MDTARDLEKNAELSPFPDRKTTPQAPGGAASTFVDFACISLNIASTVCLVWVNKWYDFALLVSSSYFHARVYPSE